MTAGDPALVAVEIETEAWLRDLPAAEALAREAAEIALDGPAAGAVSILLTDDATVAELNDRFRGLARATNVLSFPAPEPVWIGARDRAETPLGDIALAFGVCDAEARAQGKPLADHLRHLVIHGVLHLLGYDHEAEAEAVKMEMLERALLARLGVPDPYGPEGATAHD